MFSRSTWCTSEQGVPPQRGGGGLAAIPAVSLAVARVHAHSPVLWELVEFSSGRCQSFAL